MTSNLSPLSSLRCSQEYKNQFLPLALGVAGTGGVQGIPKANQRDDHDGAHDDQEISVHVFASIR